MAGSSMPTKDDIRDREDARCRRTYDAITRPGRDYVLSLRWVDVMPRVEGPSLIDEAKRERAALDKARRRIKAAKVAPVGRPPEVLRRREMERTWYHRRMAERAGTNAQRAADREAQRRRSGRRNSRNDMTNI